VTVQLLRPHYQTWKRQPRKRY